MERRNEGVLTPPLRVDAKAVDDLDFDLWALDTFEWLGLVSLQSPRVFKNDNIDSYLSQYSVPGTQGADATNLIILAWRSLVPSTWIRTLFVELR